jgi:putative ABC transport system permease protein
MGVFRVAWLNLWRRPASTLLCVLGLGLGLGLAGFLVTLGTAVGRSLGRVDPAVTAVVVPKSSGLEGYLGGLHFGAYRAGDIFQLDPLEASLRQDIRPRHAIAVARFAHVDGIPVVGVDGRFFDRPAGLWAPELAEGDRPRALRQAVMGAELARRRGLAVGQRLEVHSDLVELPDPGAHGSGGAVSPRPSWSGEIEVVGRLARTGTSLDRAIFVPLALARETWVASSSLPEGIRHRARDGITHLWLTLDEDDHRARDQAYQIVHVGRAEQLVDVAGFQAQLGSLLGRGKGVAAALLALLLLLAGATLAILMSERMTALRPRLKRLAALGWRRRELTAIVAVEAGLVTLAAGLCALAIGAVLGVVMDRLGPDWLIREAGLSVWHGALAAGMVLVWGVSVGLAVPRRVSGAY